MSRDPIDDPDALARYVAGECTAEEAREVEARLAAAPELRDRVGALRRIVAERREALRDGSVDVAAALAEVRARVAARAPARHASAPVFTISTGGRRRWSWATRAAAAVLVTVGAGAAARHMLRVDPPAPGAMPMRVASTGPGQRASFQLPDGSRVLLGVASTLRYRVGDAGPREVALEGEAYFDVVHDERRPFVVRAGDLVAEDLGTQFVVRAYAEDAEARVIVREGKVALASGAGAAGGAGSGKAGSGKGSSSGAGVPARPMVAVLNPGQLGYLSSSGEPIVEPADTALHFAWTTGTLVLDRTTLRDALPQLGRWFDLDFRLADSALGDRLIAATLTNQPTDDALASLATALGMRVERQGRVVTFSRTGPGARSGR